MFITIDCAISGRDPIKFNFSDASLTVKRLRTVLALSQRGPKADSNARFVYVDGDGDVVAVLTDADVVEMFRVGQAMKLPLQARLLPPRPDRTATVPAPIPTEAPPAPPTTTTTTTTPTTTTPTTDPSTWSSTLSFFVNGKPVTLTNPDPTLHLAQFLRNHLNLTATKIGCGEGGCGACTVVLSWTDATSGKPMFKAINSCLRPITACAGYHIITNEGLKPSRTEYHDVQKALANANGSQCGFCSSGMVMQAYAMTQEFPDLTDLQVDQLFDGNLCRCTGFFPILKGFQTLGKSTTEDDPTASSSSSCCGTCKSCPSASAGPGAGAGAGAGAGKAPHTCSSKSTVPDMEDLMSSSSSSSPSPAAAIPAIPVPDALKAWTPTPARYTLTPSDPSSPAVQYFVPTTISDLASLQSTYASASAKSLKFVGGNTAFGVEKYFNGTSPPTPNPYSVFIDVTRVPELTAVTPGTDGSLTVGGALSISDLIVACHAQDPDAPLVTNDPTTETSTTATSSFSLLARHLLHIANRQVRAAGSWAGNFALAAHHKDFPSDIALVLLGLNVNLSVLRAGSATPMTAATFFASPQPTDIILSMTVPPFKGPTNRAGAGSYVLDSFKIMLRHQNTHALVNAVFVMNTGSDGKVTTARIWVGGVTAALSEAKLTEAAIVGNALDQTTFDAATTALNTDITNAGPSTYWGTTDAWRRQTAASLLFKVFVRASPASSVASSVSSAGMRYVRAKSSEKAIFTPTAGSDPVGKPVPKLAELEQVAGEALYAVDIGSTMPPTGLYGALALTTAPNGTISGLDFSEAAGMLGVEHIFTATDIPGKNDIGIVPGMEKLFLDIGDDIPCAGAPVALVLADTFEHALLASYKVGVTVKSSAGPIVTIADAIEAKSFYPAAIPGRTVPGGHIAKGDASTGISGAPHKASDTFTVGPQRHFYMELQNAFAVPSGTGAIEITASTQAPFAITAAASNILAMAHSKFDVKCRRTGGGFGGKLTRNIPVGAAAALGAALTGRAVHVELERVQDTVTTGAREGVQFDYTIGFDDKGVIAGVEASLYSRVGGFLDTGVLDTDAISGSLDNCYNYAVDAQNYLARTNTPATTSMRAPGVTHAVFLAETIIDRVAHELGMEPNDVRAANLYQIGDKTLTGKTLEYYSLPSVWSQLLDDADFDSQLASVTAFNKANRFRKRGVACLPAKYPINYFGYNVNAEVSVYPDGSVVVLTSACEIGQGLFTKVAQVVAGELGISIDLVSVGPTSTFSTPGNTFTGGSATSERACSAAISAAKEINTRLASVRTANPSATTWEAVIAAAVQGLVSLEAAGWASVYDNDAYEVWSAACSQVEIDVLTGELQLLSTHMVYDAGISLNPLVDVGQVQGAVVMGIGMCFTEKQFIDPKSGDTLSLGTWEYKPPFSQDIPIFFQTRLLADRPNKANHATLSSKATAEPSYALASSMHFAVKKAIRSARQDAGEEAYFELPLPATPSDIASACATTPAMLKLNPAAST